MLPGLLALEADKSRIDDEGSSISKTKHPTNVGVGHKKRHRARTEVHGTRCPEEGNDSYVAGRI